MVADFLDHHAAPYVSPAIKRPVCAHHQEIHGWSQFRLPRYIHAAHGKVHTLRHSLVGADEFLRLPLVGQDSNRVQVRNVRPQAMVQYAFVFAVQSIVRDASWHGARTSRYPASRDSRLLQLTEVFFNKPFAVRKAVVIESYDHVRLQLPGFVEAIRTNAVSLAREDPALASEFRVNIRPAKTVDIAVRQIQHGLWAVFNNKNVMRGKLRAPGL